MCSAMLWDFLLMSIRAMRITFLEHSNAAVWNRQAVYTLMKKMHKSSFKYLYAPDCNRQAVYTHRWIENIFLDLNLALYIKNST